MVVPTRLATRTRAGELTCALFEAGVGDAEIASVIFNPISIFMNRLGRPAGLNAISGLRKRLLAPQVPHLHPLLDPCVKLAAAMSARLTGIEL
jgi:hypothetical protein